jgi:cell division transport system permease protein
MSLPRHLFTPAFRQQHLGRSFAAIVGIMVFIASFATAAESALLTVSYLWGQTVETRLTVEIPAITDEATISQAERVKQATSILRAMPEIGLVMPLSDDDVVRLMEPWFNQGDLLKSLPLPTLIDVERKHGTNISAEQIETEIRKAVGDARVDDHGAWTQDVWRLVRGLSIIGGVTIALTGITLIIAVSLICRAVMAAEHETISLLHLLGTDDKDIAHHFQLQAERISLRAASVGFLIALAVTGVLLYVTRHIADLSTLEIHHWVGLVTAAFLVPVCAVGITAITTRLSVMRLIKTFP